MQEINIPGLNHSILIDKDRENTMLSVSLYGSFVARSEISDLSYEGAYAALVESLRLAGIFDKVPPTVCEGIVKQISGIQKQDQGEDKMQEASGGAVEEGEVSLFDKDALDLVHRTKKLSSKVVDQVEEMQDRLDDIIKDLE